MQRRHDIDALRALAFALVILYHVGMAYVAGWHWHLKSEHAATWLQWPMQALNIWRMDLVFLVSGLAFSILLQQRMKEGAPPVADKARGRFRLLGQRSWRLLLPLAFGMAVVVPYQPYAQGVANGLIEPGFSAFLARYFTGGRWPRGAFDGWDIGVTWNHLWYLPYLWAYTAVWCLALPLLQSGPVARLAGAFRQLRGTRLLVLPMLPLMLYSLTLWPYFPQSHDLVHDLWLHAVYFTLFGYGVWIGLDKGLWAELTRIARRALLLAVLAFVVYGGLRWAVLSADLADFRPAVRMLARLVANAYLWFVIVAVLGAAHCWLNRPWPWLRWAGESVYPWYMLHQTLIIVALVWLMPLHLGPWIEPLAVLVCALGGCWLVTDGLVRRVRWLRPLFGLKAIRPAAQPAPSRCLSADPAACPSARSAR
ncbi:acyltransferase family protein [Variovorax sp. VNK109]|uniref:acyltransferase family protein n=1 Tax=Variovorax sp. VNK109 TaxID=3400919 RepID=UPI003C02315D